VFTLKEGMFIFLHIIYFWTLQKQVATVSTEDGCKLSVCEGARDNE